MSGIAERVQEAVQSERERFAKEVERHRAFTAEMRRHGLVEKKGYTISRPNPADTESRLKANFRKG